MYHHHGIVSYVSGTRDAGDDSEPEVMIVDFGVQYDNGVRYGNQAADKKLKSDVRPVREVPLKDFLPPKTKLRSVRASVGAANDLTHKLTLLALDHFQIFPNQNHRVTS